MPVVSHLSTGSTAPDSEEIDIELMVTISEGIFGQTTSQDDIGKYNPLTVQPNFGVEVFIDEPSTDPENGIEPHASAVSDENGFYEIPLEAGH
jgi:hypothetical protein